MPSAKWKVVPPLIVFGAPDCRHEDGACYRGLSLRQPFFFWRSCGRVPSYGPNMDTGTPSSADSSAAGMGGIGRGEYEPMANPNVEGLEKARRSLIGRRGQLIAGIPRLPDGDLDRVVRHAEYVTALQVA